MRAEVQVVLLRIQPAWASSQPFPAASPKGPVCTSARASLDPVGTRPIRDARHGIGIYSALPRACDAPTLSSTPREPRVCSGTVRPHCLAAVAFLRLLRPCKPRSWGPDQTLQGGVCGPASLEIGAQIKRRRLLSALHLSTLVLYVLRKVVSLGAFRS